ncbi:translation initiation factor IF-3 [Criblamydia sequanensis]|uniref:Translation initiation factor IF-3 n=1 Tax=Candidatus Criblamydia sequanensis CRIB-18 TaxID=1437425 RepID=A0A090D0J1_9BACT|nr:translation initiation factor IF-3 [Criblamydia sequanensis]CDR33355.1 Translation initiation factor IF-3 [Criblamydia sequanensis CRIB-18]
MRSNREIRAHKVRLINEEGEQVGIVSFQEALTKAEEAGLDLVEIVPTATPPICKIINFGKFRYDQTKREKESKKAQHQIKVKEVKLKPNIDEHDLQTKLRQAREFLDKGNKVKITLSFRGREMAHPEIGENLMNRVCEELAEAAIAESEPKRMGRILIVVLAPKPKKK